MTERGGALKVSQFAWRHLCTLPYLSLLPQLWCSSIIHSIKIHLDKNCIKHSFFSSLKQHAVKNYGYLFLFIWFYFIVDCSWWTRHKCLKLKLNPKNKHLIEVFAMKNQAKKQLKMNKLAKWTTPVDDSNLFRNAGLKSLSIE